MSGPRCTICSHPKRRKIEAMYPTASTRLIALKFRVSQAAVNRHKKHIRALMAKQEQKPATSLRERFDKLVEGASNELEKATVASEKIGWYTVIAKYMDMAVRLGIEEARRREVHAYQGCDPVIVAMWERFHEGT